MLSYEGIGDLIKVKEQYISWEYNYPMNNQHFTRLSHIKQYISTLNDSLTTNDHMNASNVIHRFKKSIIKSDQQVHASQFVLDCLKTKNEKLRNELNEIEKQKRSLEIKVKASKIVKNQIKPCRIQIYITRLTISLNDCKKIQYLQSNIHSDYTNIYVNSLIGDKYQNYIISISEIQQLELKIHYLYLCILGEQVFHIIIKFKSEKDAKKWEILLQYARLILKNGKKKNRLFEEEKEKQITSSQMSFSPPASSQLPSPSLNAHPSKSSFARHMFLVPQIPTLNLNKVTSPSESIISEKKFNLLDKEEKNAEKNTQRSLVNAMNVEGIRSSGNFNVKDLINNEKRFDLNRPPNLQKTRNSSGHDFSVSFQNLKNRKLSGYRKQSQDMIKPQINMLFHQKMMEKYRQKEEREQDSKNQSFHITDPIIQKLNSNSPQQTQRLKRLQEKKKDMLKQSKNQSNDKPVFMFDNKISWMGIQENDEENKSKSSNPVSIRSKNNSAMSQSVLLGASDDLQREARQQDRSEHITEKSQQQSPRLPKSTPSYDVPHKISYNNGIVFQLHQVQKGVSTPLLPGKENQQSQNSQLQPTSSSEDSNQDHSDPSSHENHTQSQDNNARIEQLKKGIILTKCSQNGFWTHQKILYLSENQSEILSKDIKQKKIKRIKIVNVKEVEYKKFDKGIIKHISKIQQDKCFVIRALDDDSKIKNFQFVSNLAEPLQRFATNLKLYVEYFKRQ